MSSLKELTAKKDRCGDYLSCPAVFEDENGRLIIVGAKREVANRVGPGEAAIAIDPKLVARAVLSGPISSILRRGAHLLMRAGL